jgi:hypothetical protein
MTKTIIFEYLEEPKLQFGQYFEHQDTKTGLAEFGPFGQNIVGLHPSEIKLGFIGTGETIARAKEWFEECGNPIESHNPKITGRSSIPNIESLFAEEVTQSSHNVRLDKILNPDFIGFNTHSPFHSQFQMNERWDRTITPRELEKILHIEPKQDRILTLVGFLGGQIESIATLNPVPDIIILALTSQIEEMADMVQVSQNYYLNLRRAIKAKAMRWGIPIQLLRYRTTLGKDRTLQEKSLRAWNFCTAQYYKADGVPWRLANIAQETCFIGISFYIAEDIKGDLTARSSVAQAFDHLGQGLILRGDPFPWDAAKQGRSPHLTQNGAFKLVHDTLDAYMRVKRIPPRRVVIHKTSEFWGKEHGKYNERDGFYEGIEAVFPHCETDFVTLRQTGIRLFREGSYPPLRGTYFTLEGRHHFLYTMGFIPYLDTYPGSYVPEPWYIAEHHGGSSPKEIFREVLALTKMNVNNCAFADGTPITLSFSQKIGEIMKHIPENGIVQSAYKFYM